MLLHGIHKYQRKSCVAYSVMDDVNNIDYHRRTGRGESTATEYSFGSVPPKGATFNCTASFDETSGNLINKQRRVAQVN
jgi:hypothetical protein